MFNYLSKKELELIDKYFEQYIEFTQYKQNSFRYIEKTGNKKLDKLFNRWNTKIKETDNSIKQDIKLIGELVLTTDKLSQGIFMCRIKSTTNNPMISTLANTINQMLDSLEKNMEQLESTLKSYANDDFRINIKIDEILKSRMLSVMQSINHLGISLNNNAKENLKNGDSLKEKTTNMNKLMNSLAKEANIQASSLEEISASVEDITSIARNNVKSALQMVELGKDVKNSVLNGQDLAQKTVYSMEEIDNKVKAINSAITIIDQISFQTNILSLNAAVEAATAGEAGKGFAVVAQEVRNLANKSADAAKEIKTLVEDANIKASEGKNISETMIEDYNKLNNIISETIKIIEDVNKTSQEQVLGMEQINSNISLLDKTTQENAEKSNLTLKFTKEIEKLSNSLVESANNKKFI
ncbi:Methyl-accepting chemotaxis protein II [Aliarcobacter thereius]|uniref:Methyl-accepting chemotaxis protein II n=4 Tax=Aliarcobacter thereius TaxID=544718 RepID=A0A1C0B6L0_9BACT|nr:methyl-accepting chemotaxis protein [Aliarcobacter thereius]OCL86770.1 Methyl-accepting chemotaxis protein II [Aliarcobacter thereius]OCL90972.1 Methyl-accepting chemotaxis protein II [Aliarcobacter thereius]OCL96199.1 Methyl-accepting chemotaxis protein II [Aliarcobacter thereius LMG 24486]OCL98939.1 Methyl-accepting chemotaxis protein II [Aliarcobacter thereius]QBF15836.1 MCP-domain signal transduction protein [Aliarcobacter thereius LMG 24486]